MSIFGTSYPKFLGNPETTLDEILLEKSVILKDEPEQDSYNVKAVRTGRRKFINAGKHWIFQVKVHLWKYDDPQEKYLELKNYECTKVYLYRRADGNLMSNVAGEPVNFLLKSVERGYLENNKYRDYVVLTFLSLDYIDNGLSINGEWAEIQPIGDINSNWIYSASNYSGTKILLAIEGGGVYLSNDYGETWAEVINVGNRTWNALGINPLGNIMLACAIGQGAYMSTDSGENWEQLVIGGLTNAGWTSFVPDYDGSVLFIADYERRLYLSTDAGETWTEPRPFGDVNKNWSAVGTNHNGSVLVACCNTGRVVVSTNGGADWNEAQPAGDDDKTWYSISVNNSGQHIYLSGNNVFYKSSDYGATWIEMHPNGNNMDGSWQSIRADALGRTCIACAKNERVYWTRNYGETWEETMPTGVAENKQWLCVTCNGQGTVFTSAVYGGRVYLWKSESL
ncbi:MAG: sialidase family protein [Ignavibacteriaceae bacterium]|jgi:photosystem II stability/assembly factor-like uncharacterized protein|nr:sialidase family protein [Ignavibacteriaceae bacterium]